MLIAWLAAAPILAQGEGGAKSNGGTGKAKHATLMSEDDLNPADTIDFLLKKRNPYLDLAQLGSYQARVTKSDLLRLNCPDGKIVRTLRLDNLRLNDSDIEAISHLPLQSLGLNGNDVKDLHALMPIKTLQSVYLDDTRLSRQGWLVLAGLPELKEAGFCRSNIKDSDLALLHNRKTIRRLYLGGCSDLSPHAVALLRQMLPESTIEFNPLEKKEYYQDARALDSIRSTLMDRGMWDEADLSLRKQLETWEKRHPLPYPLIADALHKRAQCQKALHYYQAERAFMARMLDIYFQHMSDYWELPGLVVEAAIRYEQEKFHEKAISLRLQANDIWLKRPLFGWSLSAAVGNQIELSHYALADHDLKKAKQWADSACKLAADHHALGKTEGAQALLNLAEYNRQTGNPAGATRQAKAALAIVSKLKHCANERFDAAKCLSQINIADHKYGEAESLLKQAMSNPPWDKNRQISGYRLLAQALSGQGKTEKANQCKRMAGKLMRQESNQ